MIGSLRLLGSMADDFEEDSKELEGLTGLFSFSLCLCTLPTDLVFFACWLIKWVDWSSK